MSSRLAELKPETRPLEQERDAELATRSLGKDERAFRELVQRYSGLVYNIIYRMTNNRELSEEMTQEAFMKAYKNLRTYDTARPFRPWLLRIASNATLSELRKRGRHQATSLDELQESGFSVENEPNRHIQPGHGDEISTSLERSEASQQVLKAMDKLDPRYKQALLLRYQQDLSYEEVAEALEVPLNTVRTWLRRGLEKLRDEVKELAI